MNKEDKYNSSRLLTIKELDLKLANRRQENNVQFWDALTGVLIWGIRVVFGFVIVLCVLLLYLYKDDKTALLSALSFILSHVVALAVGHFIKIK